MGWTSIGDHFRIDRTGDVTTPTAPSPIPPDLGQPVLEGDDSCVNQLPVVSAPGVYRIKCMQCGNTTAVPLYARPDDVRSIQMVCRLNVRMRGLR